MTILNNPKGFGAVLLVGLIPILVLLGLVLGGTAKILKVQSEDLHTCRQELLVVQKTVRTGLTALLALNNLVTSLQVRETLALAKLAAAVASENPIAIANATRALNQIYLQQRKLRLTQQKLIKGTESTAGLQNARLIGRMTARGRGVQSWTKPLLAVKETNPQARVSRYEVVKDFETKSTVRMFWRTPASRILTQSEVPSEMLPWPTPLQGQCAATIRKRGTSWKEEVAPDKS